MEEEDFIQLVAEAIESCMDVEGVTVPEDGKLAWVLTADGERFCVAVVKHDEAVEIDDVDDEEVEPEGLVADDDEEEEDE